MGNCLVTKLKGTISNNTLPYIDSVQFTLKAGISEDRLVLSSANTVYIDCNGCRLLAQSNITFKQTDGTVLGTDISAPARNVCAVLDDPTKDGVFSMFNLDSVGTFLGRVSYNVILNSGVPDLLSKMRGGAKLEFLYYDKMDTSIFSVYKNPLGISNLAIQGSPNRRSKIEGDVSNLGIFANAAYMEFANTNISGTIESLVNKIRENKTSGTMEITTSPGVYFEGASLGDNRYTLTWTENSISCMLK